MPHRGLYGTRYDFETRLVWVMYEVPLIRMITSVLERTIND